MLSLSTTDHLVPALSTHCQGSLPTPTTTSLSVLSLTIAAILGPHQTISPWKQPLEVSSSITFLPAPPLSPLPFPSTPTLLPLVYHLPHAPPFPITYPTTSPLSPLPCPSPITSPAPPPSPPLPIPYHLPLPLPYHFPLPLPYHFPCPSPITSPAPPLLPAPICLSSAVFPPNVSHSLTSIAGVYALSIGNNQMYGDIDFFQVVVIFNDLINIASLDTINTIRTPDQ